MSDIQQTRLEQAAFRRAIHSDQAWCVFRSEEGALHLAPLTGVRKDQILYIAWNKEAAKST